MNKPLMLNSLTFSDKSGEMILIEEYNITFKNHEDTEKFIQSRYKHWTELLGKDMTLAPQSNGTIEEAEIQKIFKLTAIEMGLSQSHVFRRTRIREVIEVRRYAIAICTELGLSLSVIGKASGFYHATVGHHKDKFFDLCDIDKKYKARYIEVKDAVLTALNGRYKEDGSGDKLIQDEKVNT